MPIDKNVIARLTEISVRAQDLANQLQQYEDIEPSADGGSNVWELLREVREQRDNAQRELAAAEASVRYYKRYIVPERDELAAELRSIVKATGVDISDRTYTIGGALRQVERSIERAETAEHTLARSRAAEMAWLLDYLRVDTLLPEDAYAQLTDALYHAYISGRAHDTNYSSPVVATNLLTNWRTSRTENEIGIKVSAATGDVIKCDQCGRQTRSVSRGCSVCGRGEGESP